MRSKNFKHRFSRVSLPYLNNWRTVFLTLALNGALSFILNFKMQSYDIYAIGIDAVICALLTSVINVLLVYQGIEKSAAVIPTEVPVSRFMMLLPKSRLGMIATFGVSLAVLCAFVNCAAFYYFGFKVWTFAQFMVYKLIYSLFLSEKIVSLAIFRMVQPDYKINALSAKRRVEPC